MFLPIRLCDKARFHRIHNLLCGCFHITNQRIRDKHDIALITGGQHRFQRQAVRANQLIIRAIFLCFWRRRGQPFLHPHGQFFPQIMGIQHRQHLSAAGNRRGCGAAGHHPQIISDHI